MTDKEKDAPEMPGPLGLLIMVGSIIFMMAAFNTVLDSNTTPEERQDYRDRIINIVNNSQNCIEQTTLEEMLEKGYLADEVIYDLERDNYLYVDHQSHLQPTIVCKGDKLK